MPSVGAESGWNSWTAGNLSWLIFGPRPIRRPKTSHSIAPCASGAGPHHRRPRRAGRSPAADRRGGSQSRERRGPARPPPPTLGRAEPAAEAVKHAGRTGDAAGLAGPPAVRAGLNQPGAGPLVGMFRPPRHPAARSVPRSAVGHPAPPKAIQPPPNPVCLRPRRRRGPVPVVIPGWPVERPVAGRHPASPGDRRPSRTRLKKRGTGSVGMPDRSKPAGAHGRRSALQDIVIPPEPSGRSGVGSGDTRGRWTVNRVPRSGSDSNSIRPPCNCTIP